MPDFKTINVGDAAELSHVITQDDLDKFTSLTGDDNKLHVDEEYAKTTPYKKPVVHGMLSASFISTIIGTKLPGDGALWFAQSIEFLLPVRVGDEIKVVATVTNKNESQRYIDLSTEIFNQHNQKILTGSAKVKIVETVNENKEDSFVRTKRVLVVGSTGGIGKAVARKLAQEGYELILHYHKNEKTVLLLKKELEVATKIHTIKADLLNEASIRELCNEVNRKFDYLSGFVNAATTSLPTVQLQDLKWHYFDDHININIKSNFLLLQHLLPLMQQNKYGKVVLLISQAIDTPSKGWLHYITAKSALHGFAKAMSIELSGMGIRVNCVSPGMVDTDLVADIPEKQKLLIAARAPLKRLATANDVADAIVFLLSEKSDYLTGETIRINGGQFMI